jgi:hypothetical protein
MHLLLTRHKHVKIEKQNVEYVPERMTCLGYNYPATIGYADLSVRQSLRHIYITTKSTNMMDPFWPLYQRITKLQPGLYTCRYLDNQESFRAEMWNSQGE